MGWVEPLGPRSDDRLADDLPAPELLSRQVDLDAGRQPVPHVRLDPLAVEVDPCRKQLPAEEVVDESAVMSQWERVAFSGDQSPSSAVSQLQLSRIACSSCASVCTGSTVPIADRFLLRR